MKQKRIGFYDYTVVLTYGGFLASLLGVLQVLNERFWDAIVCLMIAGICDMFDGAVAATKKNRTKQEKRFGIQIDSLSDLVSFGVMPAVFVYVFSGKLPLVGVICCAYTLCALIRLAYYNVLEEERQDQLAIALEKAEALREESRIMAEEQKIYLGLPVTVIAITLPALFFLYDGGILQRPSWFAALLAVTAVAFVTPVEIRKPKVMGKLVLIALGALEVIGMAYLALVGAM